MQAFICTTCGMQYPPAEKPPPNCPICDDERQYVPQSGQGWTTQEKLAISHVNGWHQYEPGIFGVATQPRFAIGQRAVLMRTAQGNLLWDCISMLDAATVTLRNQDRTVDVTLDRGVRVSGVVRSQTGIPLEGASVNVSDAQGIVNATYTDETGRYSLAVPAGPYTFDFFAPFPSQVVSIEGRPVTVDRSMTMDVTLADANP